MSRPHVSLIIPVHNAEPFLTRCLDSAAAQTEPQLEIICVDDASTDASGAMLDARASQDSRFRVVHRGVNGGESAARNLGVSLARGEYLAFLDHDDMLEPDACRLLYQAAREANADIVKGRVKTIDYDGQPTLSSLQLHTDICSKSRFYFADNWWSALYRASMVQGRLRFANAYPLGGDMLFLTEALIAASTIICVDDLVYTHFLLPDSGASRVLTPEKIRSTISTRLLIIERLHTAHIDITDPEGYRYKVLYCFMNGIDLLRNRCIDGESHLYCCDYLFTVKKLHRHPEAFLEELNKTNLFPIFSSDGQEELQRIVQEYGAVYTELTIPNLNFTKLRSAAARRLTRGKQPETN